MFEKLLELKDSGLLKAMVKSGLMSAKVFNYLEIYMWVDAKKRSTGKNISTVVKDAEITFGVSSQTIWTAIKTIKEAN